MLNLVRYYFCFCLWCILFYIWKNKYKFVKKKKCNSSMIMYVILNVLWIVFLNIVYNGIMRFIMYILIWILNILVYICFFNNLVCFDF